MEAGRQLDAAGSAGARSILLTLVLILFAPGAALSSADSDYDSGMALAQRGQLDEARAVFLEGQRRWPNDPRFPIELGGVAFKQKQFAQAAKWLRRGARLNPDDFYAADFLATVYFLQGNLEAALKYWNRVGKPRIENVKVEPGLRVDPVLLDHAFTFAPGSTLSLSDLLDTRERIHGLGIFPGFNLRLEVLEDGGFETGFAAQERNGFGKSKLEALLSTFRGVGYQTVFPEYYNLGGSAVNLASMVRWDAQKRRLMSSVSGPLRRDARRRYRVGLDLRDENWDLRSSSRKQATSLGALNLRRYAVDGEISSFRSRGWSWSAGAELSYRDYRGATTGPGLSPDVLLKGYALKQIAQVNRELWRVPERRFECNVRVSSEAAALWSSPAHSFEKVQAALTARWLPTMAGDDYAIQEQVHTGKTFGQVPFDELFMLGLERDNDLWLRAHIGTRDGRKGSAPLGRDYFLSNWEIDKNLYNHGFFSVKLSPFLDVGRITGKCLWDTGAQAKVRLLGVGFAVIFGKDLRSGQNTVYVTTQR